VELFINRGNNGREFLGDLPEAADASELTAPLKNSPKFAAHVLVIRAVSTPAEPVAAG
jgi:hypothetical protein